MFVLTNCSIGNILKKSKDLQIIKSDFKKIKQRLVFHRIIFWAERGRTYAAKGQQLRRVDDSIAPTNLVYLSGGRLIVWKRKTNLVKGNAGLQAVL